MKSPLISICLLVLTLCIPAVSAEKAEVSATWKIEVVPSRYSKNNGAVLYATKPADQFYIILHNVSGKDQKVWRDWCSWGHNNISMEAELADGSKVVLKKSPKKWGKNYPDASLVPAGKSFVFEVHLAWKPWQGVDKLPKEPFKLTVKYQIKASPEATEKKVWLGTVTSKPLTVTIRQ